MVFIEVHGHEPVPTKCPQLSFEWMPSLYNVRLQLHRVGCPCYLSKAAWYAELAFLDVVNLHLLYPQDAAKI